VARTVADALRTPDLEPKVWDEETFDFSDTYIESLENELDVADFAVVVVTADDTANVRKKTVNLPRDNVIFELGLFTGRLGRKRCFFLRDAAAQTQIASDLTGVNSIVFSHEDAGDDPHRKTLSGQLERLRSQMLKRGPRLKAGPEVRRYQEVLWRCGTRLVGHFWERMRLGEDDKSAISYVTVTLDESTNTPHLEAQAYGLDGSHLAGWHTVGSMLTLGESHQGRDITIRYRWEGKHSGAEGQRYGGEGEIVFDDNSLSTGSGHFYDTNFADAVDLPGIGKRFITRVKHFGFYRCSAADEKTMSQDWSDDAVRLVCERIASLRGR
jgi:Predicted nucleotide-binding protein containing TIR-like domain